MGRGAASQKARDFGIEILPGGWQHAGMSPLALILALLAAGAAYYEYSWQQQSSAGFQSQIQQWESQLAQLKSENKKLSLEKKKLSQQAVPAPIPASPGITASMPGQAPAAPGLPPASGSAPIEDLGTFTTITGKTYQDAKLLKIEATDIVISDTDGITQVSYAVMPADMQKKFGWDPQKSTSLTAAEIRYQEQVEAAKEAAAADGTAPAPAPTPAPATP